LSKIWDALKQAQEQKPARPTSQNTGTQDELPERRRSERYALEVPIFVYGHAVNGEPFFEETRSLEVGADGGLLILEAKVSVGQKLLLTNKLTQREIECQVIHVLPLNPSRSHVGVAFVGPALDFWRLAPSRGGAEPNPPQEPT
jgi:hypothetical protein